MTDALKISLPLHTTQLLTLSGRTLDMLPGDLAPAVYADGAYHYQARAEWIDLNQVSAARNVRYHNQVLDWVERETQKGGVVLELGGGVGYDALAFLNRRTEMKAYIFSDISPHLVDEFRRGLPAKFPVVACALDATALQIADGEVDVLFMIAAFHHIPDAERALREFDRVVKPGGTIIFGIEPNGFWSAWMQRLKPLYRALFPRKAHSVADDETEGFSILTFKNIGGRMGWDIEHLVPVWFFSGFLHYGLEAVYRLLRLKKRIVLPVWLEEAVIRADEMLLAVPWMRGLAWLSSVC